jgi:hypothetical protein
MPLNMELSFAHSNNVAAVGGAWPVMGFTSHQQVPDLKAVLPPSAYKHASGNKIKYL